MFVVVVVSCFKECTNMSQAIYLRIPFKAVYPSNGYNLCVRKGEETLRHKQAHIRSVNGTCDGIYNVTLILIILKWNGRMITEISDDIKWIKESFEFVSFFVRE